MSEITSDLSDFGYREMAMARDLLDAYVENRWHDGYSNQFFGDGVQVWMNPNSGYVFLSDEDYNTALCVGGVLVPFFSCPECGHEGTADEYPDDEHYLTDGYPEHGQPESDEDEIAETVES